MAGLSSLNEVTRYNFERAHTHPCNANDYVELRFCLSAVPRFEDTRLLQQDRGRVRSSFPCPSGYARSTYNQIKDLQFAFAITLDYSVDPGTMGRALLSSA
ncbi:hypothetical protein HBH69_226080 [Parastagonospora nodorum]|nr:hypothetical protein HBI06_224440 [Parastagonospora nodorum]KAH4224299.1 hypothetical protein HBI05_239470 [Parastagonospora nodorum]KAH5004190.1 hypothetical protein HBI75_233240 [Parastagonospora nodorum]KAH5138123.1 hypothetical protein HBH69_226080 [Parastagonospora nodorum]KAH5590373.1 hypothetical protein HBI45_216360 [Parastagonospora nodorum]